MTFRNAWNVATSYPVGDAVSYNGSSYISLSGSNAEYSVEWCAVGTLAQQGATGATGIGTAEDLSHASSAR